MWRHVDVPKLRSLCHVSHVGHEVVAPVDGVGCTGLHAGVEEIVHLVLAVGIVGERAALPQSFTPDLGELGLQTQIEVEVADEPVDLVPNATIVAVGIVVIVDDVAHLGHVVRVVEVGLALV